MKIILEPAAAQRLGTPEEVVIHFAIPDEARAQMIRGLKDLFANDQGALVLRLPH